MTSQIQIHQLASKRRRFAETIEISNEPEDTDWAKYLVISAEDSALARASPFLVDKTIQSIAGTVTNVTKQRNGNLMVECAKKQQSLNLLKCDHIGDIKVKVSPHVSLNTSRGILRDREKNLHLLANDVILEGLKSQKVTAVKRFIIKRDGKEIKTNTFLLTFSTPVMPKKIKVGYINANIDFYYPSPLRCFTCQKFGHTKFNCKGNITCYRCGHKCSVNDDSDDDDEDEHSFSRPCHADPKCVNCNGNHCSSSKECPVYKKEVEIIKIKVEKGISYPEAKAIYLSSFERASSVNTYAAVASTKKTRSFGTQTDISGLKTDLNTVFVFSQSSKPSSSSQTVSTIQQASSQQKPQQQRPPRKNRQSQAKSSSKSDLNTKPPSQSPMSVNLYPDVTIKNKFESLEVEMEDEISPSPSSNSDITEKNKNTSKEKSKNESVVDGSKSPTKPGRRISLTRIKSS